MRIPLSFSGEEIPFKKGIKEDIMDVVALGLDLEKEYACPRQASKAGVVGRENSIRTASSAGSPGVSFVCSARLQVRGGT